MADEYDANKAKAEKEKFEGQDLFTAALIAETGIQNAITSEIEKQVEGLRNQLKAVKQVISLIGEVHKHYGMIKKSLESRLGSDEKVNEEIKKQLALVEQINDAYKEQTRTRERAVDIAVKEEEGLIKTKDGVISLQRTYEALTGRHTSRLNILFRSLDRLRKYHGETLKKIFTIPSTAGGAAGKVFDDFEKKMPGLTKTAQGFNKAIESALKRRPFEAAAGVKAGFSGLKEAIEKNTAEGFKTAAKDGLKSFGLEMGILKKYMPESVNKGEEVGEISKMPEKGKEPGKTGLNMAGLGKGIGAMAGMAGTVAVIGQIFQQVGQQIINSIMEVVNILRKASPVFDAMFKMLEMSFKLALMPLATIIGFIFMPYIRKMLKSSADLMKNTMQKLKEKGAGLTGDDLEKFQMSMAGEALTGFFDTMMPALSQILGVLGKLIMTLVPYAIYELGSIIIDIITWLNKEILKAMINLYAWIAKSVLDVAKWIVEKILGAFKWLGQMFGRAIDKVAGIFGQSTNLESAIGATFDAITGKFDNSFDKMKDGIDNVASNARAGVDLISQGMSGMLKDILHALIFGDSLSQAIMGQGANIQGLKATLLQLKGEAEAQTDAANDSSVSVSAAAQEIIDSHSGASDEVKDVLGDANKILDSLLTSTGETTTAVNERLNEAKTLLNSIITDNSLSSTQIKTKLEEARSAIAAVLTDPQLDTTMGEKVTEVNQELNKLLSGETFLSAFDELKNAQEKANAFLSGIEDNTTPNYGAGEKAVNGVTLSDYRTLLGLTSGQHMNRALMDDWLSGNFEFAAAGGIFTSPTPTIIGEAGPEAVIPLDNLNKFGGKEISVNISIAGSVYGVNDLEKAIRNGVNKALYDMNWRT